MEYLSTHWPKPPFRQDQFGYRVFGYGAAISAPIGRDSRGLSLGLLGKLRLQAANVLEKAGIHVRNPCSFNFLWVVDFPLFEYEPDSGKIMAVHHPFTLPRKDDVDYLYTDPLKARSQHYDLVLNGCEVGGGSIRIHDPSMQRYVLQKILGIGEKSLGFLNEALDSGAPPHGGIALDAALIALMLIPTTRCIVICLPLHYQHVLQDNP
ncbi:Aspartate--tRNA ligase, mitochondrial [Portunus trituberculatus]|uniref:Aspartate--tRNA ligase, mitochondrial n=1 Tax=Portunus trituberculatus TaxID=210409 RepID=A0A5B7FW37_PORTR|nr:Aspartate--tRNA ligase, mitochondrial [Portunus trituberculatus]